MNGLTCQVANQSVGIFDIGSRKIRLIFHDLATALHQPAFGFFDIADCDFQHGAQLWTGLDEQVNVIAG